MVKKGARLLTCFLMAFSLALVAFPMATATHNNKGTVKVHDNEDENPDQRNVPHVSCDFWIEGFKMGDDSGWLEFYSWPPTGDKSEVTPTGDDLTWTADSGNAEDGWGFLKGPYQLPAGHYRLEAYTDDGHPGRDGGHFAKAKVFWVEPCEGGEQDLACPPNVAATATSEGIHVTWDDAENATGYVVYRAEGGGDFEEVATLDASTTEYHDGDVEPGVTYEYMVTAVYGDQESEGCPVVEATAIPFFGPVAGALALAAVVGAFVVMRRRS